MNKRECAIVTAYTGVTMLAGDDLGEFYKYVEHLLGYPVMTHELASKALWEELKRRSKDDFLALCRNRTDPRVLSLKEVRSLQGYDVVWLEDNDKSTVIPAIVNHVYNTLPNMVSFTAAPMREVKADMLLAYGKRWRAWSSEPTNEQREATPWQTQR